MDLISLTLRGFRRFEKTAVLRTTGKIIALIGPNEAGKSSLIEAAKRLQDEDPISPSEVTRGYDATQTRIEARFRLTQSEVDEAGLEGERVLLVQKLTDGLIRFGFEPAAPDREVSKRDELLGQIRSIMSKPEIAEEISVELPSFLGDAEATFAELVDSPANLPAGKLRKLREIKANIDNHFDPETRSELRLFMETLDLAIANESAPSPHQKAVAHLTGKIPKFLEFDAGARSLLSEYAVSDLRTTVPQALSNLFMVARLEMSDLLAAIDRNDTGAISTIQRRVNRNLREAFRKSWRQSGVEVALRLGLQLVEIQVVNEMDEFSALAERSEGLRQFVALHSFILNSESHDSILLIDEAEQRLHYDAQADLVFALTHQKLADKVIYTTHSAGCLPEDLGRGVKLVAVDPEKRGRSTLINKFWANDQEGLLPLLMGLGASTLAFFPTRRAVMVEGASDMLLLPVMFAEATGVGELGFQLVPGLSAAGRAFAGLAQLSARHVLYLTDGDDGGDALVASLKLSGVPTDRILQLGAANKSYAEIEDYIKTSVLVKATNTIISDFYPLCDRIEINQVDSGRRMQSLERLFSLSTGKRLPKVELAYHVLSMLDSSPELTILDSKRRPALKKLAESLREKFEVHSLSDQAVG
jgi:hypothetical protein